MNEWPSNATELLESWIFCYILWISTHCLWSLLHCLSHFNPGLYPDCPSSWSQAWVNFFFSSRFERYLFCTLSFLFGMEGSFAPLFFLHLRGVCMCVWSLVHLSPGLEWKFLIYNIPFSRPRHRQILVKIQIKVHRKEGRSLSNVVWPVAWILVKLFLLESKPWAA